MSRHRNVRSMNYSDEYEGYDDVYGHSYEDEYGISPSDAGFIYDRSRSSQVSAYLNVENDIAEEDESLENETAPKLSDEDEARLRSCVEEIQNVTGDSIPLTIIREAVITCNFDYVKALDQVLTQKEAKNTKQTVAVEQKPVESIPQNKIEAGVPTKIFIDKTEEPMLGKIRAGGLNVTKGFEPVGLEGSNLLQPSPRSQSPASGYASPSEKVRGRPLSANNSRCHSPASGRTSPMRDLDISEKRSGSGMDTPASKMAKLKIDVEAQYKVDRGDSKDHVHMVVIGHVDAGKSTLMGHLLYALGQVSKKTMHKYETESKKLGKQSFVYAWILDETGEERSRGITMDVGQSRFETKTKVVHLLDAPGHKDFIPNMISGATQADVAILVVDATTGEFETGFESGGQTREHALLVRSLGVSQLVVAVNKLDTVNWSQHRFQEICGKLGAFLKQAGFRDNDVTYIPCSGLAGENLVAKPNNPALVAWYQGPTLIDVIDSFKTPERPITKPMRMSVSDIYKGIGSGHCVSGRVETGCVQSGDKVLLMPQNEVAQVRAILIDEVNFPCAYAGDLASVTLANCDPASLAIGFVLCDPLYPVPVLTTFEARIVVFNISIPITCGYPVVIHAHSLMEQATITKLLSQLNKSTGEVVKKRPRCLTKNSNALVVIEVSRPVCLELYRDVKELGRFMMRVNGVTIAAGLVTKLL